jgi:hypothetical protein
MIRRDSTLCMHMYFDYNGTGKYVEEAAAKTQKPAILQLEDWQGSEKHQSTRRGILWNDVVVFL